jgi:hypothetical protein
MAAVKVSTNQPELAHIARNDPEEGVREAANARLTLVRAEAEAQLAHIAKNDKNYRSRRAAVECLTDQSLLADIAKNDKDGAIRSAALKRVTEPSALVDFAMDAKDNDSGRLVGLWALERVTDQSALVRIARNGKNSGVRWAALKRVADQSLHADIAESIRLAEQAWGHQQELERAKMDAYPVRNCPYCNSFLPKGYVEKGGNLCPSCRKQFVIKKRK